MGKTLDVEATGALALWSSAMSVTTAKVHSPSFPGVHLQAETLEAPRKHHH